MPIRNLLLSILIFSSFVITPTASAAVNPHFPPGAFSLQQLAHMPMKQIEAALGRKLTIKEKLGIRFMQGKVRHELKKPAPANAGTIALISGILGIAFLFLPVALGLLLSIIFLAMALIFGYKGRRERPGDKKAKWGIILGWAGIALIVLFIALALALFATILN